MTPYEPWDNPGRGIWARGEDEIDEGGQGDDRDSEIVGKSSWRIASYVVEGCSVGSRDAKHDDGDDEGSKAYEPEPFERPRRGLIASKELHMGEIELAVTAI